VPSPPHEKAEKDTENADKTKPEKKEKPEWKWKHLKHTKKPLEIKTFSIFQVLYMITAVKLYRSVSYCNV